MQRPLYIIWNDDNKVGIPIIDEQHRGIISTINSLYYFIQSGHGKVVLKPTLVMLQEYTVVHFATEEKLMVEARYPAIEEHMVLHKKLVKETNKISFKANREKEPDIILKFLKEWWLNHIRKEDRKYIPSMRKLIDQTPL